MVQKSIIRWAMAALILIAASCKVNKTAMDTSEDKPAAKDQTQAAAPDKDETAASGSSINNEDSLFASISRSFCYGTCPVYTIMVYKSGYVRYQGIHHVDKIGIYSTRLTKKEMDKIKEKAIEIGYFELADEYDDQVTDVPSTITCLNFNGQEKRIKNRWGGPERLKEYEMFFDQVFENKEWEFIGEKIDEK